MPAKKPWSRFTTHAFNRMTPLVSWTHAIWAWKSFVVPHLSEWQKHIFANVHGLNSVWKQISFLTSLWTISKYIFIFQFASQRIWHVPCNSKGVYRAFPQVTAYFHPHGPQYPTLFIPLSHLLSSTIYCIYKKKLHPSPTPRNLPPKVIGTRNVFHPFEVDQNHESAFSHGGEKEWAYYFWLLSKNRVKKSFRVVRVCNYTKGGRVFC